MRVSCNSSHGSHHHVVLLVHNSQKGKRKRCTVGAGCGVSACCSSAEREQPAHSPRVAEPPPPAAAPARAMRHTRRGCVLERGRGRAGSGGLRRGSWARLWRTLTTAYCSSSASGPRAASAATSCFCGRGRCVIHSPGGAAGGRAGAGSAEHAARGAAAYVGDADDVDERKVPGRSTCSGLTLLVNALVAGAAMLPVSSAMVEVALVLGWAAQPPAQPAAQPSRAGRPRPINGRHRR